MNYFITATDTDGGKTFLTALLTRALRTLGFNTIALKPIASGSWNDSQILQEASEHQLRLEEITPVFYKTPLAPIHAAPLEGTFFSLDQVLPALAQLKKKHASMIVEGVGGWLVPLSSTESLPDLARAIGFPILLVVRNRLGAINHALLTLDSIRHSGCTCAGIILNHHPDDKDDIAAKGNRLFFKELTQRRGLSIFLEIESDQKELSPTQLQYFSLKA
ncbi:MAG: dethiobiotin synthase [Verrucomicrobiae bacterium]|jgi:dethiobiotin synthetase|nr:dethiobiotin synthase [Verrucomicrobiae bacterium]